MTLPRHAAAMQPLPDHLFETIADYTYDWESWMSPEGRPLWINPAVERITGATVEQCFAMADYPLPLIDTPDQVAMAVELATAAAGGSANDIEFRIRRTDGVLRWGAMSWQPLYDEAGRALGFRTSVRDITRRKEAEAAQAAARLAAEQASRAKSTFLAAASHDLRQPIQAAALFVAALARRGGDVESRALVEQIRLCLDSTQELLDALLDISRLDAQVLKVERRSLALGDLFERLETEFASKAAEKGLALRCVGTSHFVDSDPLLLYRILQNFTANAIRYTPSGRVLIGARRHGDQVRIEVHDKGIGIAAEQIPLIFQEFTQIGNPERDRGKGLGLGLAIVERLSRLLGTAVGVRSTPGRGSSFWVSVPLAGAGEPEVAPAEALPSLEGRCIALLDDEPVVLAALGAYLTGEGVRVLAAESPEALLAAIAASSRPLDLLVVDYRLRGGVTGAEAVRRVEAAVGRAVPALLLTGDTEPGRLAEAQASGIGLLHKPVEPAALLRAIGKALEAGR